MQVYLSHTQMLLSLSFCKECHQHISKSFHPIISMIFLNLKCCHHSSLPADNADGSLLFLAPTQCWGETHNQLCLFPWYVCVRPFNIHHQYSVPSLCFVLALLPDSPASHVWPHTPHSHVLQVGKDQIIIHSYLLFSNTGALVGIAIVLNITCISLARERRFVVKYLLKHHLPSYFRYSGPPKCLRNFFSGFMGRVLCLSNYYHQVGMIKIWNLLLNCYPRFLTLIKDW